MSTPHGSSGIRPASASARQAHGPEGRGTGERTHGPEGRATGEGRATAARAPRTVFGRPFFGAAACIPKKDALLLEYQAKWVVDDSRLKICEKSRQIGWTWSTAYRLVSRKSLAGARLDAWISSRDDIQAKLFIQDCKAFAALLDVGAQDLGERVVDEKGHSASVLRLANGLTLNSLSSNPDAQAGKRGDRELDEFALHPDPAKLYSIAYPGITWGGSMEIFSTHRGTGNFFNKLIREIKDGGNPKGFSLHTVTLQTALDQGFLYKLQCKLDAGDPRQLMDEAAYYDFIRAGCVDEESFLQEFMCVPSDDNSAFLEYALIDKCLYPLGYAWAAPALEALAGELFVGVDVARKNDLTVIWVMRRNGGLLDTVAMIELKDETFDRQEKILYDILKLPTVRRCCIDETGLGRQFAERAKQKFGYKVEGVTFTGGVKEDLAFPLRAALEDGVIRIPNEQRVIRDLRGIRKETTTSGNIRFAGERTAEGHSDRFWALALAVHAAKAAGHQLPPKAVYRGRRETSSRAL